jgi:hypothetical protein
MHNNAPTPRVWFNPNSLEELTSNATWTRGRLLYSGQKVLDLKISPADGYWLLEGQVQGSERWPYTLSHRADAHGAGEIDTWDADCSCPVGYNCKHGVALTMKAAYQGLRILGSEAAYTPCAPPAVCRQPPRRWKPPGWPPKPGWRKPSALKPKPSYCNGFTRWTAPVAPPRTPHAVSAHNPSRLEQYLYLLKGVRSRQPPPAVALGGHGVLPRKASGELGQAQSHSHTAPQAKQRMTWPAAQTARSCNCCWPCPIPGYGPITRPTRGSPSAMPQGQAGRDGLATWPPAPGACTANADGSPETVIQWGPTQTLDWSWNEVTPTHGGAPGWALRARLHADFSEDAAHARSSTRGPAPAKLLLNTPPLYLDTARGLCGPVQAPGISDAQLAVLLKAPPLQPSALEKHQQDLMQRLGDLPAPPVLRAAHQARRHHPHGLPAPVHQPARDGALPAADPRPVAF